MYNKRRPAALAAAVAMTATIVAGCGSSGDSSSGSAAGKDQSTGANVSAATRFLAPYSGKASQFPVTAPLKQRPKPGTTVIYLNPGTAIGSLMYQLLQPAAATMGVKLSQVKVGTSAQSVSSAMDSVVSRKPDAVIDIGIEPVLFANQLKQLRANGAVFVAAGISKGEQYGIKPVLYGNEDARLVGSILAAWAVKQSGGHLSNPVFYSIPELGFSKPTLEGLRSQLSTLCPACKLRVVDIPASAIGTSAPQSIVSDLQAHPKTDAMLFATDDLQIGLPAALKTAGLSVPGAGAGPSPTTLAQIKSGQQAAGSGTDLPVVVWALIDQVARELTKQPLSGPAANGITDHQILTKDDITFDPSKGWTGYPDFVARYKKLWGLG